MGNVLIFFIYMLTGLRYRNTKMDFILSAGKISQKTLCFLVVFIFIHTQCCGLFCELFVPYKPI